MVETIRVEQWLYTLLTTDTGVGGVNTLVGGRIYAYQAPSGAMYPIVVYSHHGGHDVRGVGSTRIMASLVYQVKVVGQTSSMVSLVTIADRLDALLQGASGSVVGGQVLMCVREAPVAYAESDDGVQYCHLGGLYRLWAR